MAATHSNRSPSPLCSRPASPHPRNSENNSGIRRSFNSENNSGIRRSFSGNNPLSKPSALTNPRRFDPITPANSPSDFARKRFVGEEKENNGKEHVLKASKLQSPAKVCKNFMSPTISAASKFTPSPRKKVLVERNDPVRTSISLADGKAIFFSNMSPNVSQDFDLKFDQNQKTESILDPKVSDSEKMKVDSAPKPSKRVLFSDVPSDSFDASESQLESAISSSTSIAPLDADPSLPPYDPKTNYLSPRPQFLHYKPNPRIGILLNKEKGLDPELLQDSLIQDIMFENLSESSEGTEESQTEETQNEEMEITAGPQNEEMEITAGPQTQNEEMEITAGPQTQNEEIEITAGPADMVIGMDEMEADSHVYEPSEPLPVSTPFNNGVSGEEFVQRNGKKLRAFYSFICFLTLVMFLIACVSISMTHSPPLDDFVIKDLSSSDLSNFYRQSRADVSSFAKVNLGRLARSVNQLSVSFVSFVSKLANELGNGDKQVPLQFMNLSDLQRNAWDEGHFLENEVSLQLVEDLEVEEDLNPDEMDTFEEAYEEVDYDEKGFNSQDDGFVGEKNMIRKEAYADIDSDEKEMSTESVEVAELEQEIQADVECSINTQETNLEAAIIEVVDVNVESERIHFYISSGEEPAAIPQDQETNLETDISTPASLDTHKSQSGADTQSEGIQSLSEVNSLAHKAMGVSSLFAGFLAIAAFLYRYKRKANVVEADPPLLSKETGYGFTGTKQILKESEFSQNWQTEVGESSCPSEMSSSFQKSASYSNKGGGAANEVESSERKKTRKLPKRESLASSSELSMGSPSYGSFTTYERIPIKHANGDDEIVTPVRRSSRIRNHQFTSP